MKILLVSKFEDIRAIQREFLRDAIAGVEFLEAETGEEALTLVKDHRPQVLITGNFFESHLDSDKWRRMRGDELARSVREILPSTTVVLCSSHPEVDDSTRRDFSHVVDKANDGYLARLATIVRTAAMPA